MICLFRHIACHFLVVVYLLLLSRVIRQGGKDELRRWSEDEC